MADDDNPYKSPTPPPEPDRPPRKWWRRGPKPVVAARCNELVDSVRAELTDLEYRILGMYLDEKNNRTLAGIADICRSSLITVEETIDLFETLLPPARIPAKSKIQIAADRGRVTWNETKGQYRVIQIVMPDELSAEILKNQIQTEHGDVNELLVRQGPTPLGRWIVQLPVVEAKRLRLLPRRFNFSNLDEPPPFGMSDFAPHQPRRGSDPPSR